MELVRDDDKSMTIRFENSEYFDLLGIVHVATVEYKSLSADIHDLPKSAFEKINADLFSFVKRPA